MSKLAVVLISKNQAWNIARLIESVLRATATIPSKEIVLVDSASTDDTVDVAKRYPITILRLQPNQTLTPAAGRYVGYKHTTSEFVLFLDGDMELWQGWLDQALRVVRDQPAVAVVAGQVVDLPKAARPDDHLQAPYAASGATTEVRHVGGAALYRRLVLEKVGPFNPYLHSDEEPELCIRIRHAGYQVLRLEYPIAYHYSDPSEALSTLVGRWRRNLYLGAGQAIRYNLGKEVLWPYVKERGFGCTPALALVAGLVNLLWSIKTHQWIWFRRWWLLAAIIVTGDAYRKRSPYQTLSSLLKRLFIVDGTVRGFLMTPLDPNRFPGKIDLVKEARHPG